MFLTAAANSLPFINRLGSASLAREKGREIAGCADLFGQT
jgi:hypothetical protein